MSRDCAQENKCTKVKTHKMASAQSLNIKWAEGLEALDRKRNGRSVANRKIKLSELVHSAQATATYTLGPGPVDPERREQEEEGCA